MSLDEFLTLATQALLVLIAAMTLASYLRGRDQARLDIALMFAALAFIVVVQRLRMPLSLAEDIERWLTVATQIAIMAHPYLLLRLVLDFRPVPAWMQWFAFGGMMVSWVALVVLPPPLPLPVTLAMVVYFLIVEFYSVAAFISGARRTAGVSHWRMILAASGSGFLALVILNAGLSSIFPSVQPFLSTVNQFFGLFAMLAYYTGFATPYWLRRYWQLSELHQFLRRTSGPWAGEPIISTLVRLCEAAVRAVGGMDAMVVLWREQEKKLIINASTNAVALPRGWTVESKAVWHSWESQTPVAGTVPADFDSRQTPIAVAVGAKATIIVPIKTVDHAWGVMQVFSRRKSLFPTDDISLLSLFAEQTAIALDYATLVTEQRNLIRQLSRRTEQLETTYKELESFSYSVSHDLRSPLRHISGYLEMLQKHIASSLDEKGRRYITVTLEEAGRMSVLIDDLLAFSRFGRAELHHTEVDFAQLVQEVIAGFEHEYQDRPITWHIHPLPCVRGDRSMLRLVWANLISNALKFSRQQPQPEIEIGFRAGPDEQVFFIGDNGVGFNMEYAGQLFGVFQRLHATTEFEGTGIGLATTQRIIQRHGGRTWAEGKEEEGATFYFTLPVLESESEETLSNSAGDRREGNDAGGFEVDGIKTDIIS